MSDQDRLESLNRQVEDLKHQLDRQLRDEKIRERKFNLQARELKANKNKFQSALCESNRLLESLRTETCELQARNLQLSKRVSQLERLQSTLKDQIAQSQRCITRLKEYAPIGVLEGDQRLQSYQSLASQLKQSESRLSQLKQQFQSHRQSVLEELISKENQVQTLNRQLTNFKAQTQQIVNNLRQQQILLLQTSDKVALQHKVIEERERSLRQLSQEAIFLKDKILTLEERAAQQEQQRISQVQYAHQHMQKSVQQLRSHYESVIANMQRNSGQRFQILKNSLEQAEQSNEGYADQIQQLNRQLSISILNGQEQIKRFQSSLQEKDGQIQETQKSIQVLERQLKAKNDQIDLLREDLLGSNSRDDQEIFLQLSNSQLKQANRQLLQQINHLRAKCQLLKNKELQALKGLAESQCRATQLFSRHITKTKQNDSSHQKQRSCLVQRFKQLQLRMKQQQGKTFSLLKQKCELTALREEQKNLNHFLKKRVQILQKSINSKAKTQLSVTCSRKQYVNCFTQVTPHLLSFNLLPNQLILKKSSKLQKSVQTASLKIQFQVQTHFATSDFQTQTKQHVVNFGVTARLMANTSSKSTLSRGMGRQMSALSILDSTFRLALNDSFL